VSDTAERRCIRCNVTDSRYHEVHGGHLIGLHAPECDYHTGCMLRQEAIAAHAAGYAEGRAEERADVRRCINTNAERMLEEMAKSKSATFKRSYRDAIEVLIGLGDIIAKGAHVGAAKKGAT
jgi:hypothetical protein